MYYEEDWVPLSALQHYIFCPRQCALNYVEKVWVENYLTAAGRILHRKTEEYFKESRGDIVHEFGVEIASNAFKVFGQADVLEYHFDSEKKQNLVSAIPIEYKRGKEKSDRSDEVQLCAQGMCIEEMIGKPVRFGYLFYFSDRLKKKIDFSDDLRDFTKETIKSVHGLFSSSTVPIAEYKHSCKSCSMKEVCFPKTAGRGKSVKRYIGQIAASEGDE